MTQSRYSICITLDATEMPRCFSISIQSEVACREALRAFTEPAIWIAPENSSSFSVSVVLPASGWEMMAKVRRRRTSVARSADMGNRGGPGGSRAKRGLSGPRPRVHTRAMPEMPDVTVYAERLAARVVGLRLHRLRVLNPF